MKYKIKFDLILKNIITTDINKYPKILYYNDSINRYPKLLYENDILYKYPKIIYYNHNNNNNYLDRIKFTKYNYLKYIKTD